MLYKNKNKKSATKLCVRATNEKFSRKSATSGKNESRAMNDLFKNACSL